MTNHEKRMHGQYYTVKNPFDHPSFMEWAENANLKDTKVIEPFAGSNNLINHLMDLGMVSIENCDSFDIEPGSLDVQKRDTLKSFPKGYDACVTNPPWLAKNSATRRNLPFPDCQYDDIYKLALEKCLMNCRHVAAIIPESFIRANLFQSRCTTFILMSSKMFSDTENPTGFALFGPNETHDIEVWDGHDRIAFLNELKNLIPRALDNGPNVKFNSPNGNLGFISFDNTVENSIRFCKVSELEDYNVKGTNRMITIIDTEADVSIDRLNERLENFRADTHDMLIGSFRGIRKDGMYRRRLDWSVARGIIHQEWLENQTQTNWWK